ncbi:SIS domain-containing protein [Algibacillus agarilyticus]|uniref:SIS domain-containing protein n=1 Tax=Algibacillus agarilyticus TaxID=2234133 RepID=UPI001E5744E0|nr:SIS domain-containing protein [Algibacillus agarilyticus]
MKKFSCNEYAQTLSVILSETDWSSVEIFADKLKSVIKTKNHLYICGNGGSAGNAMHLANDFLYGVSPNLANALKVEALSANSSVLTCLGNDLGYDSIFSRQLKVKAEKGDLLLVLSGSGNSSNIIKAIEEAKIKGMYTVGILGFDGGKAKEILDMPIHFDINDMQISEDLQLIVGHMLMKLLSKIHYD